MINPSPNSRNLANRVVTDAAGRELYEIRTPMPYAPVPGIARAIIQAGDSLFAMAYRAYGSAQLWWAIADFNEIFDPTTETTPGREILIPPRDYVEAWLSRSE